jgi:hypothetical protein
MMQQRALTAPERKHLSSLRDFITEAARHHRAAVDAHGEADDRAVARAHNALRRCLDGATRACRALADEGMAEDIANTSSAQTSSGVSTGTSADGRTISPYSRDMDWLARVFPGDGVRH